MSGAKKRKTGFTKQPPVVRYIDPLTDFGFKRIFGSEPNKDLLIDFLNSVFEGRKTVKSIEYRKTEYPAATHEGGGAIFDLLCTGGDGQEFIIEVQRGKQLFFKERALFYTSRLLSDEAPKGRRQDWKYNLPEVYLIALLEDFSVDDSDVENYIQDVCLCNRKTGTVFYDRLGYIYVELCKFVKEDASALQTQLEKWLYVLKHMSRLQKIPAYLKKPVFEKLFNIAEYSNFTKEEKMDYDSSLKYKWDNANVLEYAREEGREQGEHKKAIVIAAELKKRGFSITEIAAITGLKATEIKKL